MPRRAILTVLAAGLAAATPTTAAAQGLAAEIALAEAAAAPLANRDPRRLSGWRAFGGDEPLMGRHWIAPDAPDYVSGQPIDPARPSNWLFTDIDGTQRLVALSYNVRIAPGEAMPQGFAGPSDRWHVHDMSAFINAATETRPLLGWLGKGWLDRDVVRRDGKTRLAMVHLWLIPNPLGRFAAHNPALAYLDLGLPADWAEDMAAAHGVALAAPDGCDAALDGQLWVAGADRRTARTLHAVCDQLASFVRGAVPQGKARLNAHGRGAWQRLQAELAARLTADEKRRIMAISEHGTGDGHGGMSH